LVRNGSFSTTLTLAESFLTHKHDLMHKATGWLLREVGKRDTDTLLHFLNTHAHHMPRTALRYAIEKFPQPTRTHYLSIKKTQ
ncbi:MAG: DNA alkylation repair protein, partial [Muribaculaceae bacterium]|nr:DNA alkylation repair protein [Muribaculaceae bacterium]